MQRQTVAVKWEIAAGVLLCAGLWCAGSVHAAAKAAEQGLSDKAAAPASQVADPMETLRERLKEKLQAPAPAEEPSAEPLDPEEAAMERLRVRLVRRLSMPSELHVTLRAVPPSAVDAVRQAAHSPKGRADGGGGRAGGVGRGATSPSASAAGVLAGKMPIAMPWAYEGPSGPPFWSRVSPEFSLCGSGKRQSPIDVRDGIQVNLEPLLLEYRPSALKVVDDGRGIQAKIGEGNMLGLRGRQYELQSVRFHTPAQEHIGGKVYDMSAEFLHRDKDGQLLVLVLMLEKGGSHPGIQSVLDNLPLDRGDEVSARQPVDWGVLMPPDRGYYIYLGSLTEPPCTEGVLRVVLKAPATLSVEQYGIFSRLYPMNVRPIQAMAGRVVKQTN
jgi:carbonic anhydrase